MVFLNSIGLDEVGRGPLAGPVSVGGVFCGVDFWNNLPERYHEITDSKKLTAGQRSRLAELILSHPDILVSVHSSSAKIIDRYGIVTAIRRASMNVITDLTELIGNKFDIQNISIMLDGKTDYGLRNELTKIGNLKVGDDKGQMINDYGLLRSFVASHTKAQGQSNVNISSLETIVHGDALVWQISAASIVAKVQRDEYMIFLSQKKKYRPYKFDRHKGYGTLLHRSMIAEYGLSDIHRKSFCRNIIIIPS